VGARRRHAGSRVLKEMRDISGVEKSGISRSPKKNAIGCWHHGDVEAAVVRGGIRRAAVKQQAKCLLYCCFTAADTRRRACMPDSPPDTSMRACMRER
jgi:hypothetical protein